MIRRDVGQKTFLILVRGLGGTGKTTLSTFLSKALSVPVLNRDDIKAGLADFKFDLNLQSEIGYQVMNKLASVQLQNGVSVVLDANARFRSIQPYYEQLALLTQSRFLVVTCTCSDQGEWARRIQRRGSSHPISFDETESMLIEEFDSANHLQFDSATMAVEQGLKLVLHWLQKEW